MMQVEEIVIKLVRTGLTRTVEEMPKSIDWMQVMEVAMDQGVVGICFDAMEYLPAESRPDIDCLMEWVGQVSFMEDKNVHNWNIAKELADVWHENGLSTVVLKGFSVCQYYPKPLYRYSGDLDVVLLTQSNEGQVVVAYDKGNDVMKKMGVTVDRGQYKHSKFEYKDLSVENHRFCISLRGDKRAKRLEAFLEHLLKECELVTINDSKMLCPPSLFNALFFTVHNLSHFLHEKISLRHLCDWAVFVQACKNDVDWTIYDQKMEEHGMTKFSQSMNSVADYLVGNKDDATLSERDKLLLDDIFSSKIEGVYDISISSRLRALRNIWGSKWKYKEFTDTNALCYFTKVIVGFFLDRNPRIQ